MVRYQVPVCCFLRCGGFVRTKLHYNETNVVAPLLSPRAMASAGWRHKASSQVAPSTPPSRLSLARPAGATCTAHAALVRVLRLCLQGNGKRRLEAQCIEPHCTFNATIAMVRCTACEGDLHSTCGADECRMCCASRPRRPCNGPSRWLR